MSSRNTTVKNDQYKWVILTIATMAQVAACFFVQSIGPLAGYFQQDFNLTNYQVGMLSSAAQLFPLIGLLIAGELLDRFSEKYIVGLGAVGVSIALFFGSYASSYIALLICFFVVGAFYSSAQPGGAKSVASWFPIHQRGLAMGIRQAGLPLGGAIAGLLLPFIANHYGLPNSFIVGAAISLIWGVIFILLYKNKSTAISPLKEKHSADRVRFSLSNFIKSRMMIAREPHMKNIIFSGISLVTVQYVVTIFISIYFHQKYHFSLEQSAYLFFVSQFFGVIGRIVLAYWGDRCQYGRFFPVYLSMICLVIGFIWLIIDITNSTISFFIISTWLGFFGLGWYGPWVSYIADKSPAARLGFSLGLAMAVNQFLIIISPPIFGFIQDVTHEYTITWSIVLCMLLISLFLTRSGFIHQPDP